MRKDLVVFRCKDCIEALKEYNPYADAEGKTIPLDRIEVIEVEKEFCENAEINLYSKPQLQTPINLEGYPERPWRVVVWGSIYDREQGISEIFGCFESFADARSAIDKDSLSKYWASYEIQLDNEVESVVVYHYANCRPLADEFIKISAGRPCKLSTEEEIKAVEKSFKKMSYDRAMQLLNEIVAHACVAKEISEAIEYLFRLGFTDDELTDIFDIDASEVETVVKKIEEV